MTETGKDRRLKHRTPPHPAGPPPPSDSTPRGSGPDRPLREARRRRPSDIAAMELPPSYPAVAAHALCTRAARELARLPL